MEEKIATYIRPIHYAQYTINFTLYHTTYGLLDTSYMLISVCLSHIYHIIYLTAENADSTRVLALQKTSIEDKYVTLLAIKHTIFCISVFVF